MSFPPFSYWRARWEFQAFRISVAVQYWTNAIVDDSYLEKLADHFTTSDYFWMWPFRKRVLKKLRAFRDEVVSGDIFKAGNPDADFLAHTFRTLSNHNRVYHEVPIEYGPDTIS
jgi:hypothetical protein